MQRFAYFDLGNVLVHFDHEIGIRRLAELAEHPQEVVRQAVFGTDLQILYESGGVSCQDFAQRINAHLGRELPAEEIHEAVSAIFEPNHAIVPALEMVRASGVPMGILSNTCHAHWVWLAARRWPVLERWFEVEVLSYEVKSMKPAARIYEVCEKLAGSKGANIFFTDDRSENVTAASARGWVTHEYRNTERLLIELENWLRQ